MTLRMQALKSLGPSKLTAHEFLSEPARARRKPARHEAPRHPAERTLQPMVQDDFPPGINLNDLKDHQQFKAALTYALDFMMKSDASSRQMKLFLADATEGKSNLCLSFTGTYEGPNDFGLTELLVINNDDASLGNLETDENVHWKEINKGSLFIVRISLNKKHNFRKFAVNVQTIVHELAVHALYYHDILKRVASGSLKGNDFKKAWARTSTDGVNNGAWQHYHYGQGSCREYNAIIAAMVEDLRTSRPKAAEELEEESQRDIVAHQQMYPNPP
ncbi:hypothetical protein [Myxococcus sp. RHSTA-1-4]|uniref:hypothetical protein n=1 Tax=Myxococcus sp. RHSTA-1-4 TaxID=2874601 RepID=UPI001CBE304C|nr:hypothetical protein [Myxococcus sp. RHSTA-1-4]MBZ4419271.1 hypothetical protein [Myxococcus sp. RHSTA-1-4]